MNNHASSGGVARRQLGQFDPTEVIAVLRLELLQGELLVYGRVGKSHGVTSVMDQLSRVQIQYDLNNILHVVFPMDDLTVMSRASK